MTKYKASDVVLVKDGRLSNDVEVYLASDTDQRDAVRLAEIARLREAVTGAYDIITRRLAEPEDESDTGYLVKAATLLESALSSSPQSCTCGYASVGHHLSCPLFNQTHSTSSPQTPVTATEVTQRLEEKRESIKDMLHVERFHPFSPHVIIYDEAPGITADDLNNIPEPKPTSPQSGNDTRDTTTSTTTLPQSDGWIRFDDRLPEENHMVLVYSPDSYCIYCAAWFDNEWHISGASPEWTVGGATHWRPLPEPPEVK